jgi:hypothetical protein
VSVTTKESDPGADWQPFDYDLVVCRDFDAVLQVDGEHTSLTELISKAFDAGRVLIQAKGGSGKTTILDFLAEAASESGADVARLDALVWADSFDGEQANRPVTQRLLDLSTPPVSEVELRKSRRTLLLVDGLNEVAGSLGARLLDEVDQLAAQFPSLAVILTDRLHRRRITDKLWILATLSPVSWERIRELLDDAPPESETSLRLPYYLKLALQGDRGSRSEQHRTFLLDHGGVDSEWLGSLAAAAYAQYKANGDRGVNRGDLASAVGGSAVDSLVGAGTLVVEPTCRFAHHLVHDYLAATHAAAHPELWDEDGFDVLTFRANSMDALAMVLEQAPKDADLLVQRVYDWNFYGAASLIAEDRENGSHVSPAMELAVVTMLGERRFDRFASTADRVSDALQVIDSEVARAMMAASSKGEIIDFVCQNGFRYGGPNWLAEWIKLYTRPESDPSTAEDVDVVAGSDSVLGWTMSNVLRRTRLEGHVALRLSKLAGRAQSAAVRWRSVHALGVDPSRHTVGTLFHSLDFDKSTWVRYGSIRSLVEIALSTPELRELVLGGLADRVPALRANSQLMNELERVLQPTAPPRGWEDDTALLVETLWAESTSVEEQDRWRAVGASIRTLAAEAP